MKHLNFSRKTIILSGICLGMILCGAFYLGMTVSANDAGSGTIITYADDADSGLSPIEIQKHKDGIELKKVLKKFDKKNIADVDVWLSLGDSDRITDAYIIIVSKEDITDKDGLVSLASETLNLDSENIHIDYMDAETFTLREEVE